MSSDPIQEAFEAGWHAAAVYQYPGDNPFALSAELASYLQDMERKNGKQQSE